MLNPSSVKWSDLKSQGILQDFSDFKLEVRKCYENTTLTESCGPVNAFNECTTTMKEKLGRSNEGFPTMVCGIEFLHITKHLGGDYELEISPVVCEVEEDPRKNKKLDFVIMRIKNQRCVIVIELKFGIAYDAATLMKELAQLFLETYYTIELDKERGTVYDTTISILGDHDIWHMFIMDISCQPYNVINYYLKLDYNLTLDQKCWFIQKKVKELI